MWWMRYQNTTQYNHPPLDSTAWGNLFSAAFSWIYVYIHTYIYIYIYIYIFVFTKYPAYVVLWVWLAVLCVRSANLMPLKYHTPVTQVVIDKISTWILWEWWCKWIKQATKWYVEYQLYNAKYYPRRRVVIIIFHFHALLVKGMEISKPITLKQKFYHQFHP